MLQNICIKLGFLGNGREGKWFVHSGAFENEK